MQQDSLRWKFHTSTLKCRGAACNNILAGTNVSENRKRYVVETS